MQRILHILVLAHGLLLPARALGQAKGMPHHAASQIGR